MSLIPSFAVKLTSVSSADALQNSGNLKEWDVDFDTGQLTGKIVTGTRAVEVWVWKCLKTERFRHAIYSWLYGSELESYIGKAVPQEYIDTDVCLAIEDALLINPEITSITSYSGSLDGDSLNISLTISTQYGDATVTASVR